MCYLAVPHQRPSAYIAAVRALHIDLGEHDPPRGESRLARLLRGIRTRRLPITNNLVQVIYSALSSPSYHTITPCFGLLAVPPFWLTACHRLSMNIAWVRP